MSFLTLAKGIPNFTKAVISLWFRAPKASVKAAATHSIEGTLPEFPLMQNLLPLVTFGKQQESNNYTAIYNPDIVVGDPDPGHTPFGQQVGWQLASQTKVDPCYIGLLCFDDGKFRLTFNLQGANKGSYHYLIWFLTQLTFIGETSGDGIPGSGVNGNYMSTIEDGSHGLQDAQAEFFYIDSGFLLDPDEWHHLLLSFDVGGTCSIGPKPVSDCRLWYAIDDIDRRGVEYMGPYRNSDDGLEPNGIVTRNVSVQSGFSAESYPQLFWNNYVPAPSGGCTPGPVPSKDAALGIPASTAYLDGIFRVEMAEFQMFTDVTLDTEKISNRRAFVDAEGKPVDPAKGIEGDPRGPGERLLGKKPEILLHGSSNWKIGYNTGTLGIAVSGEGEVTKKPDGQFTPTGGINSFKPDPQLDESTA